MKRLYLVLVSLFLFAAVVALSLANIYVKEDNFREMKGKAIASYPKGSATAAVVAISILDPDKVKSFDIKIEEGEFDVTTLRANPGDTVYISITGDALEHMFTIPSLGMEAALKPYETKKVEFTAVQAGTLEYFCTLNCDDSGKIVIRKDLLGLF